VNRRTTRATLCLRTAWYVRTGWVVSAVLDASDSDHPSDPVPPYCLMRAASVDEVCCSRNLCSGRAVALCLRTAWCVRLQRTRSPTLEASGSGRPDALCLRTAWCVQPLWARFATLETSGPGRAVALSLRTAWCMRLRGDASLLAPRVPGGWIGRGMRRLRIGVGGPTAALCPRTASCVMPL
jgi:hypothetical protein